MSETVSHYRIVETKGSDRTGDVFLARDEKLGRNVVLKILPADTSDRVLAEAYAASSLVHPNIAVIYEAGRTVDGRPFIAMEQVEGERLDSAMASGPMPADTAIAIALQIASALEAAHAKGLVHRDLQPSNVVLTSGGVKIIGFGLTKLADDGSTLPAGAYSSPEQANGDTVDLRSDIFSLGAILYEIVTGERAFGGSTAAEISQMIARAAPRFDRSVPKPIDRVIRKAMAKERDARYQSAGEIVADLRNLQSGRGVPAGRPRIIAVVSVIAAVAVLAAGIFALRHRSGRRTVPVDSIAVIPFANSDARTEFLSDGITDGVIDALSQLPQLRVVSRNSVFNFKGRNVDWKDVARQLKVNGIVAGRVAQLGDRVRVSAELIDATDGHQIWGGQFERQTTDLVSLEGVISQEISDQLRLKLTGAQRDRLARRYTSSAEAYSLYLQGRFEWNQRTVPHVERAVALFKRATVADPNYTLAYVGLADSYAFLQLAGASSPDAATAARVAIGKVLASDDGIAEAHATLGMLDLNSWDLEGAERQLRRAIELNPNYATAHEWYALTLRSLKKPDEAFVEIQQAQMLDPLSPVIGLYVAVSLWLRNDDAAAIRQYERIIAADPKFGWAYDYLGRLYASRGDCAHALPLLRKGLEMTGGDQFALGNLGYALAVCRDRSAAERILSTLTRSDRSHVPMAIVYAGLGDKDKVFDQLENAYRDHDAQMVYLSWGEPEFAFVRADPRYFDLAKRIGIPP